MECPRCWTIVAIISYFSTQDIAVLGQNVVPGGAIGNRPCGNPSSTELLNSILSVAASNGVLPDLLPMLQGQELTKPLSVVPIPPPGCVNSPDPIIFSNQAVRAPIPNQNVIYATALPAGSGCSNAIPNIPQTISLPPLPPANCVPQITQAVPLENYPTCAQNGAVRPTPIVLQPQCQFNEVNPYNIYNQIVEPLPPDVNMQPLNLPILPPPQILPASCAGNLEITPNLSPCLPPTVLASDGQQLPLNLQITVPSPSVPAPKITVVSANPANPFPGPFPGPAPCSADPANLPPFQYPPQPPIIIGGCSRSSLRNMLPILLIALLSDRGCNQGGGCCCSCSCNSSGNNIPIPYPIPIPINNPVINTYPYPYSSRNRENRDDGDEDEEKKRK